MGHQDIFSNLVIHRHNDEFKREEAAAPSSPTPREHRLSIFKLCSKPEIWREMARKDIELADQGGEAIETAARGPRQICKDTRDRAIAPGRTFREGR